MAEGPERQVGAVDVVPVPQRAATRGLVCVVERHLPHVARHGHGQLAAGLTSPKSTSAMACGPASPGTQA